MSNKALKDASFDPTKREDVVTFGAACCGAHMDTNGTKRRATIIGDGAVKLFIIAKTR